MSHTTDFFAAIAAGDLAEVRKLVDENPGLLDEPGPDGASASLTALYRGHSALADELAARSGEMSIFEAAAFDDTSRLAELITADRAAVESWSADGWQPLHLAAFFGRAESARVLLDADAPVNETSRNAIGVQPLHAACAGRHSEVVWILIASDADVSARQPRGWTPLHSAAHNNDAASVKALLAAGADPDVPNDEGITARGLSQDPDVLALFDRTEPS
jgi:ankyrin repeat protein